MILEFGATEGIYTSNIGILNPLYAFVFLSA